MNLHIYLIVSIFIISISCESNSCSKSNDETCTEDNNHADKYSKDSNTRYKKYLNAIKEAENSYKECKLENCNCYMDALTKDLKPFEQEGISEYLLNKAKERGTFYQIINKNVYRESSCMFPSRCAGIDYLIKKAMSEKFENISFVVNTRDYPQSSRHFGEPLPVFSFSKTSDYYDIMYPAWSFREGGPAISFYPTGLGRWDLHRDSLNEEFKNWPWEKKDHIAFFRGSRTSSERDNLILLSREKPKIVNAQYTKNQAWKSNEDTLNLPPAPEVSLQSHCRYKYLFNFRGVAASFRHKHLFLCGSLVFHVGDEWQEFYYQLLKPWIHYIPVDKNASKKDLEELIHFVQDYDAIAKKIAYAGRDLIWKKLGMKDVTCYWKKLLWRYSKLLQYKPSLDKKLIQV